MNHKKSLLKNCLAESRWMIISWLVSFVWVIGYSLSFGFAHEDQELAVVAGVPAWVFWGVCVPWLVTTIFTCWFAFSRMQDDSLDDASSSRHE